MLTMPAWQGEPRVNAQIVDLHAYVSARAQGTQGLDRPAQWFRTSSRCFRARRLRRVKDRLSVAVSAVHVGCKSPLPGD